ncbi:MAG: hypothetical protein PHE50_09705 [Dehalococcoidales bacterium]|nr:hypothetical protein [Dehalococcoidales bacterium]
MSDLSNKITSLAIDYLGPATGRFLQRQSSSHMNGLVFETIERQHLPEFARWVHISAGLLIGNQKGKELADKIMRL